MGIGYKRCPAEGSFLPGRCLRICRGVAQPGSAPALGAGGRRFESSHLDINKKTIRKGGLFVYMVE